MSESTLEQKILEVIRKLDDEKQCKVLEHAQSLTRPKGIPGTLAVQYAREIGFSHEDLAEMEKAINEMKEQMEDFPEVNFDE